MLSLERLIPPCPCLEWMASGDPTDGTQIANRTRWYRALTQCGMSTVRAAVVQPSLFHTSDERDGMLDSGMEQGLNESYAALDQLLASTERRT